MTATEKPSYTPDPPICLGAVPAARGTDDWKRLASIMSDISETLYCAGWMQHTEYDVYRMMTEGGSWGLGDATWVGEELGALRSLSERHHVWVRWCDMHGAEPMPLDTWRPVYAQWRAELHVWRSDRGRPDPHRYDDGDEAHEGDLCIWCLAPKETA